MIKNIVEKIFKILHIEIQEKKVESTLQFIKFCIVGVTNTIVSYLIYIVVLFLLKPFNFWWDYYAGNIISFILSVLWSFYWNNKYVFSDGKENRNILKSLLKTYASYGFTGFILTNVLSYVWIEIFGISKIIAPLINNLLCVPINFILNKFWAFGKKL